MLDECCPVLSIMVIVQLGCRCSCYVVLPLGFCLVSSLQFAVFCRHCLLHCRTRHPGMVIVGLAVGRGCFGYFRECSEHDEVYYPKLHFTG